ncbi:MFS family permease [Friedmanniella endophytica]|uniref:MFS family permease n=1 Tax=Microlunatus kandeliicorticis TaxID=1759536 RepID=A0A7W3IVI1_9ACTN|nr:MFS transporter [Microlunatus kandeliicorticis]MBA8796012.1 MFS family permease [Microlunatus kandeliicorticis]
MTTTPTAPEIPTDPATGPSAGLAALELDADRAAREHGGVDPVTGIALPTEKAGWKLVVPFAIAQFTLFIALLGPVMVSMAIKVQSLVGAENATTAQGVVLGVGAIAALVANPIAGRLSDRTRGRFGRRRPWMIGGAVGLALCLLAIALAPSVPVLIVAWFCAQLSANAAFAAYLATVADQIPPKQTATITALGGVMQNVGVLGALFLAQLLTTNMIALFMVPGVIGVIGMVFYALVLPDAELKRRPPSEGWRAFLSTFWINPLKHRDFGLAWISRFLLILGTFMFTTFRFNWMVTEIKMDSATAVSTILVGTLIYTGVLVVCGQIAGVVSDKLGRRKFGVFLSVALTAVGLLALTQVTTVGHFYLVEAVLGAAYGIYMGVDLALVLAVLPNQKDAAKDLGVFNIANAAPQSLAPFLGAALLALGAGNNFDALYVVAAIVTFVGALAIIPVKKVK